VSVAEFLLGVLGMGTGVFAVSGFAKLRSRQAYRDYRAGLRATRLVTGSLLSGTAFTLVAGELATVGGLAGAAGLLAAGSPGAYLLAELALAVAAALAAVLVTGVAVAVSRGLRAPCACFGGTSVRPLGAPHVFRNACLLALLAAGLAASGLQHTRPSLAGSALAVVAGLVVALLIIRWDDLVALFAPIPPVQAVTPAPAGRPGLPDQAAR
jgi:hypothetical protein